MRKWWEALLPWRGEEEEELDVLEIPSGAPPAVKFDRLENPEEDELQVAVVRHFFSPEEVAMIHKVAQDPSVKEINDRDASLVYKHHVWRFEHQLKKEHRDLYDRLMNTSRAIDAELWGGLEEGDEVYPEIEYIVYDVEKLGCPGTIQPHRDNESQVSVVVLLTPPKEFQGGLNFFEGGEGLKHDRSVALELGDAVFFYGDQCSHWITPVVSGKRTILQMELSRGGEPSCDWPARPFADWLGC